MKQQELYDLLTELATSLRRIHNDYDTQIQEFVLSNIEGAIVYVDCARYNLQYANGIGGKVTIRPQIVSVLKD